MKAIIPSYCLQSISQCNFLSFSTGIRSHRKRTSGKRAVNGPRYRSYPSRSSTADVRQRKVHRNFASGWIK